VPGEIGGAIQRFGMLLPRNKVPVALPVGRSKRKESGFFGSYSAS